MLEISVRVSNEEKTLVSKFLEYSEYLALNKDDPILNAMVEKSVKAFADQPEDVVVRVKMVW